VIRFAATAVVILSAFVGSNWLQVTRYEVPSHRLPDSFDGYCIVQISDLHNHKSGRDQGRLLKAIRVAKPDLIAITGDLTYLGSWDAEQVRSLVSGLLGLAPVCFVSGNHDVLGGRFQELAHQLASLGVLVLQGESTILQRGMRSVVLAGVPDPMSFRQSVRYAQPGPEWETAVINLRQELGSQYCILLSHRPEPFTLYADLGFDLILAGHAHGGQIRLPGIGALYAPDQGWLPRYTSGVYASGHTKMVVSRGMGNSWFKIRLFNRPELVVVRLRRFPD
jgi:uncharacterized protein